MALWGWVVLGALDLVLLGLIWRFVWRAEAAAREARVQANRAEDALVAATFAARVARERVARAEDVYGA